MRYLGIDLARSVAIIFVILGHALTASNMGDAGVAIQALEILPRPVAAGILLPVRLHACSSSMHASTRQERTTEIVQRLLTRSLQCWILYVLSCAAYCLAAGLPVTYFRALRHAARAIRRSRTS
jgi:hypothetical protein